MRLVHKNGSLFEAPAGSILAHACNGMGVWGRGIAVAFKQKFPMSYEHYHNFCLVENTESGSCVGFTHLCSPENNYRVACMITSMGFGAATDSKVSILRQTAFTVDDLLDQVLELGLTDVHSNKFNSGLFGVPWEETEKVLLNVLKLYPTITWTVWTPDENKEQS